MDTSIKQIDINAVKYACDNMPNEKLLYGAARIFDAFGDTTRIKIISALSFGKMCVGDIANTLKLSHSAVSHQLRILRQTDIVVSKKEGKIVYYELSDAHIIEIYNMGIKHIMHTESEEEEYEL